MTNILFDPLPEAVEIDGLAVPINTDFRDCLRIILAFEDPGLTVAEQYAIMLNNLYPQPVEHVQQALEQGIKFLNGGEDQPAEDHAGPGLRLYSFRQDARFIFAAFRQTHGIDLESAALHWWAFLALFMDLGSETTFCNLVSLRKRIKTGKASKEERRMYQEMRAVIDIEEPEHLTADERAQEEEFLRLVKEGLKQRDEKTKAHR